MQELNAPIPTIKVSGTEGDFVDLLNGRGFNFTSTDSGTWQQAWANSESLEFGAGLGMEITKDTVLTVKYVGGNIYTMSATQQIRLFWGTTILSPQSHFSYAEFVYDYPKICIYKTDMSKGILRNFIFKKVKEIH